MHLFGTAGKSTLRKFLGCLLGYTLIPRDNKDPDNGKTTFCERDEQQLSEWMPNHLLSLYSVGAQDIAQLENSLIDQLNPPLNLQGNSNEVNRSFREKLKALRARKNKKG